MLRIFWKAFQSTPPRGGRLAYAQLGLRAEAVSIHAPARGATYERERIGLFIDVSIHAPARGATRCNGKQC